MTVFLPHLFNAYVWSYDYGRISAPSLSLTLIGDQRIMTVFLPHLYNAYVWSYDYGRISALLVYAYWWLEDYDRISAPSL